MTTLASFLNEPIRDEAIGLIGLVGGLFIALVGIVGCTVRGIVRTRAREATKREVAAYVAEGSMKPEDAERILNAGGSRWGRC